MIKPLLLALTLLLVAIPVPASAVPIVEEIWGMSYCSLSPTGSIRPCYDQGIAPPLIFNVLVEHVPGQQIYELSDAQLLTLGLPLPSTGILLDYVQVPGANYLYSSDRDFWDGVPLPFVGLKPKGPPIVIQPGDPGPLAETPEPATLLLLGTTLAGVGYVARRRRGR